MNTCQSQELGGAWSAPQEGSGHSKGNAQDGRGRQEPDFAAPCGLFSMSNRQLSTDSGGNDVVCYGVVRAHWLLCGEWIWGI